jgi:hypothetical protein
VGLHNDERDIDRNIDSFDTRSHPHHIMSAKRNLLDEGIVRHLRIAAIVSEKQKQNFGEALRAWQLVLPAWRESRLSSFAWPGVDGL